MAINNTGYKPNYGDLIEINKQNVVTFFVDQLSSGMAKEYFKDENVYLINACWHQLDKPISKDSIWNATSKQYHSEYESFMEQADFFRWLEKIKNERNEKDNQPDKESLCEL